MKQLLTPLFTFILLIGLGSSAIAQDLQSMQKWMTKDALFSDLTTEDLSEMVVTDRLVDEKAGITWTYLEQAINGIPIHQSTTVVVSKDGKAYCSSHAFHSGIDRESVKRKPSITSSQAVYKAAENLGVSVVSGLRAVKSESADIQLQAPDMREERIDGKMVYVMKDGVPVLSYLMEMYPKTTNDMWSVAVDANSGEVLTHSNYTTYCAHVNLDAQGAPARCTDHEHHQSSVEAAPPVDGSSYNVFAMPVESPNFGDRVVAVEPADPQWAPFGWHDIDGVEGAEFTTTEGNYVIGILDRNGDRQADVALPDGGSDLQFDFPFDPDAEPQTQSDNAIVNAFYTTNVMHDFSFRYGFDEQIQYANNNYGNDFRENDRVTMQVQSDAQNGATNNANFSAPPDGINGNMNIFVGENGAGGSFRVDAPNQIAGTYLVGLAQFGPPIDDTPITGNVVRAIDDSGDPTFSCEDVINGSEVSGNVALVDRGECEFHLKTLNAQEAGAIAVIICNFEANTIGMARSMRGLANPEIPAIMLNSTDCRRITQIIDGGGDVEVTFQRQDESGPLLLDIGLDNGVVAHEYGHGLSIRSTGGPSNSGCLSTDEQMGEGWSDYFGLVTTVMPGQDGTEARGIGTYGFGQGANGPGIRRFPYSTDKNVNPQDYDDIIGTTAPHPLGEVWADCLWDMYWLFVDRYGWDEDFTNGNGGNNQAIQLVFDGMRTQSCNPTFVDGRDAILAADRIRYDGNNQDIIWEAFAGRGVGFSADPGENTSRNDGRAAFDLPPFLIKDIVITKDVTPLVNAGAEIEVELMVINQKEETVSNVALTEAIPAGLTFMESTGEREVTVSGSDLVADLGTMNSGDTIRLVYRYATDPNIKSTTHFFDDHEDRDISRANWISEILDGDFDMIRTDAAEAFSGDFYFEAIPDDQSQEGTDITLQNAPEKEFNLNGLFNPVLRFWHYYETQQGFDGGFIQVKPTSSRTWERVEDDIFRGDYRGEISYDAFTIPNVRAFWGSTEDDYISTYVDLSDWAGVSRFDIRWRFGAPEDDQLDSEWRIDDIEIIDMVNYNPTTVITTEEGDEIEIQADGRGTVVDSDRIVSTIEIDDETFSFDVYPNPVDDFVRLQFVSTTNQEGLVSITAVDGRTMNTFSVNLEPGRYDYTLTTQDLPSGMYYATLNLQGQKVTARFVKN